jgi:hypothetical protein
VSKREGLEAQKLRLAAQPLMLLSRPGSTTSLSSDLMTLMRWVELKPQSTTWVKGALACVECTGPVRGRVCTLSPMMKIIPG